MRDDNKGVSLVELIIVVAIIALFTGVAGYGLSLSSGKAADECARKLAASIQHARTASMGKNKTTIKVWKDAEGVWTQEVITMADKDTGGAAAAVEQDKVKVGAKNVDISGGMLGTELEFDRSSGALKNGSGEITFTISKASKTYTVKIVALTGRVTVE